eukprot:scaffold232585_cov77-Attheya_sp.AAC.4
MTVDGSVVQQYGFDDETFPGPPILRPQASLDIPSLQRVEHHIICKCSTQLLPPFIDKCPRCFY